VNGGTCSRRLGFGKDIVLQMKLLETKVKAYAGSKAEESPRSFECEGLRCEISEIKRTWIEEHSPAGEKRERLVHFLVMTEDGDYHLIYNPKADRWYLAVAL
jgi:hypothetical protein